MTPTHWIAIAAIVMPLITSWTQFLLKERASMKAALATASPAMNQPNALKRGSLKHPVVRHLWVIYLMNWIATALALNFLIGMIFYRPGPWSYMYTITTVECLALIILAQVLPWTLDSSS
jgi:hypothetical protein